MKYLTEYRDARLARRLVMQIQQTASRRRTLMEVCGGQTHALLRHGIDAALADVIELIHGPGCPVCVTPVDDIDRACELSMQAGVTLTTFGDMLRVPGSRGSLMDARAAGGKVQMVYSPLDAVARARRDPSRQVVFFAVGFETTAPATALAIRQAAEAGVENFSVVVSHVRVLPAMELLAAADDCRVEGFLAAGHVCTVTGAADYAPFVVRHRLPVVVTGFEPVDLLAAILECVRLIERGSPAVANRYGRTARDGGNVAAQRLTAEVLEPCDRHWRGIGPVAGGGLRLRAAWRAFDADARFPRLQSSHCDSAVCRSGDVLCGRIKPGECPSFARACTPDHPLGAPMVSSEGTCAAYFRYAVGRESASEGK